MLAWYDGAVYNLWICGLICIKIICKLLNLKYKATIYPAPSLVKNISSPQNAEKSPKPRQPLLELFIYLKNHSPMGLKTTRKLAKKSSIFYCCQFFCDSVVSHLEREDFGVCWILYHGINYLPQELFFLGPLFRKLMI
jgi:hypothetical protein